MSSDEAKLNDPLCAATADAEEAANFAVHSSQTASHDKGRHVGPLNCSGRGGSEVVTLQVVGPDGKKSPLKTRLSDDVSTLRALIMQM